MVLIGTVGVVVAHAVVVWVVWCGCGAVVVGMAVVVGVVVVGVSIVVVSDVEYICHGEFNISFNFTD